MSNIDEITPHIIYRVIGDNPYKDCLFVKSGGYVEEEGAAMFTGSLVWHAKVTDVTIPLSNLEIYADMSKRQFEEEDLKLPKYRGEWE